MVLLFFMALLETGAQFCKLVVCFTRVNLCHFSGRFIGCGWRENCNIFRIDILCT